MAGSSAARSAQVRPMIGSNTGPLRWKPPITAHSRSTPAVAAGQDPQKWVDAVAAPRLLDGKSGLVPSRPVHLAGDQDRVLEEEAGLPLLDDLESGAL